MSTIMEFLAVYAVIVFGIFGLIQLITKKLGKNISSYLIFGIADIAVALIITIVALLDILTPGGDLNGLFGTALLMFFIPIAAVMLIVDIVLWRKSRSK